jgi:hypothetical protein
LEEPAENLASVEGRMTGKACRCLHFDFDIFGL